MKRYQVILCLIIIQLQCFAENQNDKKILHLQTDKVLYVSGENIGFKCTYTHPEKHNNVLFVDLCGEGYLISSEILKSSNNHWNGEITVPDSVQTGVYLLRAYTGNPDGSPTLEAKFISVVNRFNNNEVNQNRIKRKGYLPYNPLNCLPVANGQGINVHAPESSYSINEVIPFSIENELTGTEGGLSFSVFKIGETNGQPVNYTLPEKLYTSNPKIKIAKNFTIRGRVTKNQFPAINEMVYLSIPDSIPHIFYDYTNNAGEFQFEIDDYYGPQNMIVQTQNKAESLKIELYPYFLEAPKVIPYYLSQEAEKGEFSKLAVKRATMHIAYSKRIKVKSRNTLFRYPVYGDKAMRVYPHDYIDLNDFDDIALNILPIVKYRNTHDSAYVKLWDIDKRIYYDCPLLLVDGIPVSNTRNLNVLDSKKIKWVDMQAQKRCFGDLIMDGILAIQTNKGGFSDIEMPKNSIALTVETFYNAPEQSEPIPFLRDVLAWNSKLEGDQKVNTVEVECSYEKGKYMAVAQTFDAEGNCHRSVFIFEVTDKRY